MIKEVQEVLVHSVSRVLQADRVILAVRVNLALLDLLVLLVSPERRASKVLVASTDREDFLVVWVQLERLGQWDKLVIRVLRALLGCQVLPVSLDHQDQSDSKDLPEPLGTVANRARLVLTDRVGQSVFLALLVLREMQAIQASQAD